MLRAPRRQAGLTLLEVLVSLVLLSTVLVAVYGALRMGLRSWESLSARHAEAASERVVRNLLSRQVQLLLPLTDSRRDPPLALFDGDRQRVRFAAPLAHATRGQGLYLVELELQARRGDITPWLRYRLLDPEAEGLEPARGEPLERELPLVLDDARLDYFGAPEPGQPPGWRDNWPAAARQYPDLIRLQGTTLSGAPWPPAVMAVPARAEVDG